MRFASGGLHLAEAKRFGEAKAECGVTANIPDLGSGDSGFESLHSDNVTKCFMNNTHNKEIEARFLNINVEELKKKLISLGAKDEGEDFLTQIIFEEPKRKQLQGDDRFIRLRKTNKGILLSYKHLKGVSIDGNEEIEMYISDIDKGTLILQRLGFEPVRFEEKKRHTYILDGATIDFDTWPKVPTYIEIEGESEQKIKEVALKLGLDWKNVTFENAGKILTYYGINTRELKYITFDKVE